MDRGLDPRNDLAVTLYRYSREEIRVGTFAGAPLLRTLTPKGVTSMLDEFDDEFASPLERKQTLVKIMAIDAVATELTGKKEEQIRKAAESAAASKANRSQEMR